jgi:hypothetical protein
MKTRVTEPLSNPVPAAEYVRMSDEANHTQSKIKKLQTQSTRLATAL